ncbi:MAG TPA: hypothetical protein VH813_07135 [Candidatus Limnocylindrales bacterium]|jgi:uncharacterized protein YndB with AHSA1/START domain
MPIQKLFKRRVRARMTKTGESYMAARHQLLRKVAEPEPTPATPSETLPPDLMTSEAAMRRATGKGHLEWFRLLDAWGGTSHTHTEIARWLSATHGVPGWWTQNITVNYERARGMRARHQMANGFSVSVTRTIADDPDRLLEAFTDDRVRRTWLPRTGLRRRPTTAANTARFDWPDPPSRLVVYVGPKSPGKALVSVAHEQLPDAAAAERMKVSWREWLDALKASVTP